MGFNGDGITKYGIVTTYENGNEHMSIASQSS